MTERMKILGGLLLLLLTALLGVAAKTATLTRIDIRLDEHLTPMRDAVLTLGAKGATVAAQAAVGAVIAVVVPIGLWLLRRRRDALIAVSVMAGSLAVAFVAKISVAEHRPPQRLWVIPPDNKESFPSGHATVAAAVALLLFLLVRGRLRVLVAILGVLFALGVGLARVYLGVHYPVDVVGGYLVATGVSLVVVGFFDIPSIRRGLEDVGTPVSGRHHAGRASRVTAERR
ncbi:phosphatase PAP2 family protein [Actinoallomurus acaciae]|uniref:Phosphatase PAP2 family protein n=1 Tax=Actinoallomurus acaciae TaxID=502577 RepID=A0ABV5YL40_9ACTN